VRAARTLAILFVLLTGGVLAGLALGPASISFPGLVRFLLGNTETLSRRELLILQGLRLPRVLLGLLVGGSLACVGTVMQGVFRNPLACPYVLGLASGASAGAAAVIKLGWGTGRPWILPLGAFLGGSLVTGAVALLGRPRSGMHPLSLVLAGVALATLFSAVTATLVYFASPEQMAAILIWTMGGLSRATPTAVQILAPVALVGMAGSLVFARDLDVLALGDAQAHHLGTRPGRVRAVLLFWATVMTATAVAFAGPIGFVGLIVPHALRLVLGPRHRTLLIASFLGGAVLLVWADLGARTLLRPVELPVGLITAFLGVPFFLFLLRRRWGL